MLDPNEPPYFDRPGVAKAVLANILAHGDVLGRDEEGRTVLAVAVEDWLFDHLAALGVEDEDRDEAEELEPEIK